MCTKETCKYLQVYVAVYMREIPSIIRIIAQINLLNCMCGLEPQGQKVRVSNYFTWVQRADFPKFGYISNLAQLYMYIHIQLHQVFSIIASQVAKNHMNSNYIQLIIFIIRETAFISELRLLTSHVASQLVKCEFYLYKI